MWKRSGAATRADGYRTFFFHSAHGFSPCGLWSVCSQAAEIDKPSSEGLNTPCGTGYASRFREPAERVCERRIAIRLLLSTFTGRTVTASGLVFDLDC